MKILPLINDAPSAIMYMMNDKGVTQLAATTLYSTKFDKITLPEHWQATFTQLFHAVMNNTIMEKRYILSAASNVRFIRFEMNEYTLYAKFRNLQTKKELLLDITPISDKPMKTNIEIIKMLMELEGLSESEATYIDIFYKENGRRGLTTTSIDANVIYSTAKGSTQLLSTAEFYKLISKQDDMFVKASRRTTDQPIELLPQHIQITDEHLHDIFGPTYTIYIRSGY